MEDSGLAIGFLSPGTDGRGYSIATDEMSRTLHPESPETGRNRAGDWFMNEW